jgi:hypothetical protein
MGHTVKKWPSTVYPGEVDSECPEAKAVIDVLILQLEMQGPSPSGYHVKVLGKQLGQLWQINLKFQKRQIRILYAPYGSYIVLFRIHKEGSPQEQERAYEIAKKRKAEYERNLSLEKKARDDRDRTYH